MDTDYSALLMEYPEIISKDQLYRICHISKRKATWLLDEYMTILLFQVSMRQKAGGWGNTGQLG